MDEDDRKPAAIEFNDGVERPISPSKEVKPVLKKNRDKQTKDDNNTNKDKHLQWDEVAIEEHNELRGTRMSIDEPKTPYIYYDSGAESDDSRRVKSPANQRPTLSWDNLQSRLDSVAAVREQYPSSPSDHHGADTDHSDAEDGTRNDMRKVEFREHRKRHYNEFELVKKFRAEQNIADDDDEEENENINDDIDNAADDERENDSPNK